MRNRFAGICYRCGKAVDPGDGHFERAKNGWKIQHASCCLEHRNAAAVNLPEIAKIKELT